ncbi:hypothetical protein WJX81_007433 [Elliptochloris bilobata]|uniref:glutathione-specific gamma-glutamylcyclotransferase n=1 Tax=Elliptochloris bilobata TaxID=381761 RepID=A0AAW1QKS9_9CHLO
MEAQHSDNAGPSAACSRRSDTVDAQDTPGQVWIFGFGSLVYRPGFAYQEKVFGFIRGWRRVFWQGSTDHRGTPGAPGRVATVLEYREKQYDLRLHVDVRVSSSGVERVAVHGALVFIASHSPTNTNWLGEAEPEAIAHQHGAPDAELDWLSERVQMIRSAAGLHAGDSLPDLMERRRPDLLDD